MCGICGFLSYNAPGRVETLERMTQALAHRGPDGSGVRLLGKVGFGHRRLSIIDIDGGAQPMVSADSRYATVFNGEIYNYLELRDELAKAGAVFLTRSDTEVIAEAIRAWGVDLAVSRFRGMFAFAVYDFTLEKLYLARDPVGIKPLYHAQAGGAVFFASEQKSLLHVPEIPRTVDAVGLHDFLTLGFPVTPLTCWKSIRMFPPGHYAEVVSGHEVVPRRFWSWDINPTPMSMGDAIDAVKSVLQDSLRLHLRSDVPLGAFLSGGIDSSLNVRLLSDGLVRNLKTFNVGFDDPKFDESSAAREVARICGTDHTEIRMGEGTGDPELFETILSQYDEPFGDSSCLPTYMVSKEMRRHLKVVVSGDGGDELFGGYDRLREVGRIAALGRLPLKWIPRTLLPILPIGADRRRQIGKALSLASGPPRSLHAGMHTYFTEAERARSYSAGFRKLVAGVGSTWERAAAHVSDGKNYGAHSWGERQAAFELSLNVHADYLRKVDIASSAHGLEVRTPFLDVEVMRLAGTIPFHLKIGCGECKRVLRELARREISPLIGSKAKQGFGIPFDSWCGPAMRSHLDATLFDRREGEGVWAVFNKPDSISLRRMFMSPDASDRSSLSRHQVYQRVFMLASLDTWMRRWSLSI